MTKAAWFHLVTNVFIFLQTGAYGVGHDAVPGHFHTSSRRGGGERAEDIRVKSVITDRALFELAGWQGTSTMLPGLASQRAIRPNGEEERQR